MAVIERRRSPRGVPRSFYMHNYLQNEVTTMSKKEASQRRFCEWGLNSYNNVYNVLLTIKGPGSDTPFGVQDPAHISAFVKVKNWDVVNQEEEVD